MRGGSHRLLTTSASCLAPNETVVSRYTGQRLSKSIILKAHVYTYTNDTTNAKSSPVNELCAGLPCGKPDLPEDSRRRYSKLRSSMTTLHTIFVACTCPISRWKGVVGETVLSADSQATSCEEGTSLHGALSIHILFQSHWSPTL